MTIGYTEFVDQLNAAGNKTTRLGKGEADFSDYGNALSDELKSMITDSFDNEQDYVLQSEIASLYQQYGRSVMQRGEFVEMLKRNGYSVQTSYVKSSYIPDNKADGHYDTDISSASIGVYTISDGKGGEIVIADANGNGALEIEEVFMNQILNDIAVDVNKISSADVSAAQFSSGASNSVSSNDAIFGVQETEENEVSQDKFNSKVEHYLEMGLTLNLAEANAAAMLNATGMSYTGSFDEENVNKEEENDDKEINQKSFNKEVESLINNGKSLNKAISKANSIFKVDMDYTGIELEELEELEEA